MKEVKETKSKKYWYIQLNVNFFDDERVDWLCDQQNGYAYVVLYLKLCLKTANNNGILTRQIGDMIIPYDIDKIADMTHINVDIVRVALELYKRIGLVYEADENCNFMRLPEVPKMVGYTTQSALEKAERRERKSKEKAASALPEEASEKESGQFPEIVRNFSGNCPEDEPEKVAQEYRVKSIELRDNNKSNTNTPSGEARNTPNSESLPSQPMQSVENSVETVENAETRAERALNQRLNLHAENVIGEFKISYAYFIGKPHGDIPPDKLEGIKRAIIENGLNHRHIAAYFGDNGAGGTKPIYGDSDAKIYHFISPGVVEILKRRCGE